jgi:hypothetical protein
VTFTVSTNVDFLPMKSVKTNPSVVTSMFLKGVFGSRSRSYDRGLQRQCCKNLQRQRCKNLYHHE